MIRLAVDTGGTFTDLVVEDADGLTLHKAPTTPADPPAGILDVLGLAAAARDQDVRALLESCELLVHATTRALNAVVTQTTARTALLVTEGHEDVLVLREGGRPDAFDFSYDYPSPYIPKALTFGLPERIGADGAVVLALTEDDVVAVARRLAAAEVEAVAVCLLWSIVEPAHEQLVRRVLERELPGVPITLSHELNPAIREYRRACSVALDASLRPVMDDYLGSLERRLRDAGFAGRLLMATSSGALLDLADVVAQPIHTLNSGPSLAPIAGRRHAGADATAIVVDAGGTSFDVSLVRDGEVPRTRETWIGPRLRGWMTGFPSVDVRSIGAGGGSIAWVDPSGLLHVGPQSAGADPGPAAYGRDGRAATLTDAAVVLGYLDPAGFLNGTTTLDREAARAVIAADVAAPLGLDLDAAAAAVLEVATQHMVAAIEDVTISAGVDPATAVLVGGGGAIGLNLAALAARLDCRRAVLPATAATLSASGALIADVARDFAAVQFTSTARFAYAEVDAALADLEARCRAFGATAHGGAEPRIELFVQARYPRQVWELEIAAPATRVPDADALAALADTFHRQHAAHFAFSEPDSPVEITTWRMRVSGRPDAAADARPHAMEQPELPDRATWFPGLGRRLTPVRTLGRLVVDAPLAGPAIVETGLTTVVVGPGQTARRRADDALELENA